MKGTDHPSPGLQLRASPSISPLRTIDHTSHMVVKASALHQTEGYQTNSFSFALIRNVLTVDPTETERLEPFKLDGPDCV